jgi:hypothetical protein
LASLQERLVELAKPVPDEATLLEIMGEHFIPAAAAR